MGILRLMRLFLPLLLLATAFGQTTYPISAQIAAGANWKTRIVIANLNAFDAPFLLRFCAAPAAGTIADCNPLLLDWRQLVGSEEKPPFRLAQFDGMVPKNGLVVYETVPRPDIPPQVGYAVLVVNEGLSAQAIFQQLQADGRTYAAASPFAHPRTDWILPFDNTAGAIAAAAIANPARIQNRTDVAVRRDPGGSPCEEPTRVYNSWDHKSDTMQALFGSQFVACMQGRLGTVEFKNPAGPLALLGLRFAGPNGPFSSFDPVNKVPWDSWLSSPPTIAQIVAGGVWNTTLTLINIQPIPASFRIDFRGDDGGPLVLNWNLLTPSTTLQAGLPHEIAGTIPGFGVAVLRSQQDLTGETVQGYVRLLEGALVKGQALFTQELASGAKTEAASVLRRGARELVIPFDNVGNTVTSLALTNPTDQPTDVQIRLTDELGLNIGEPRPLRLNPRQHTADTVVSLFGNVLAGKRGLIRLNSTPAEINALGLRFEGDFFTSFPVIQVTFEQ